MLSKKEEDFVIFWEANREQQKKNPRYFIIGLCVGLAIGVGIVLLIYMGWYERANMVANAKMSPTLLVFIVTLLSVFIAYLYQRFQWDMREQQYLECLAKKKRAVEQPN
jgi:membrane protein YdbS with pleckstrin-like domain